jgi:AcrR family transcriptional regulator
VYAADKFKDKAVRTKPSQTRGKERVRVILAASLELFKERGLEQVTTNDIVRRAGIPIGSLYRYYPNRDSIIAALVALYVEDISHIFDGVGRHPMLRHLSWEEVLLLMVDGWVHYVRLNGSLPLLYAMKANPRLLAQNKKALEKFMRNFGKVIKKRCPNVAKKDVALCFQLCLTAVEMGVNKDDYQLFGPEPQYEVVSVVASHMLRLYGTSPSGGDTIMA